MSPTELLVRVYILDGWDIESKDEGSPSDPYLRFKLGKQVIRDKENT